jgi:hypothetical protein
MTKLGKGQNNIVLKVEPHSLLPRSDDVTCGSTLSSGEADQKTMALIEQLAELIVDIYLNDENNIK